MSNNNGAGNCGKSHLQLHQQPTHQPTSSTATPTLNLLLQQRTAPNASAVDNDETAPSPSVAAAVDNSAASDLALSWQTGSRPSSSSSSSSTTTKPQSQTANHFYTKNQPSNKATTPYGQSAQTTGASPIMYQQQQQQPPQQPPPPPPPPPPSSSSPSPMNRPSSFPPAYYGQQQPLPTTEFSLPSNMWKVTECASRCEDGFCLLRYFLTWIAQRKSPMCDRRLFALISIHLAVVLRVFLSNDFFSMQMVVFARRDCL
ncbi:cuticle collagen rol-6 [Trichinella spiralis]|uniref:cuticle collagen rol-6 n=1 Tax=Trichinella spiralis TaxID=6334 RepID=UPI0001EFDB78|nr:cuticle collagen rol-6 [Trichinella spiralis]